LKLIIILFVSKHYIKTPKKRSFIVPFSETSLFLQRSKKAFFTGGPTVGHHAVGIGDIKND
jgi:hypothetical protein